MKKILFSLIAVLISFASQADCAMSGIWVYPSNNIMRPNSLVILEGYGMDQETIRQIGDKYTAELKSKSEVVRLEPVETFEGMMLLTEIVLRPQSSLKAGETYTLIVRNKAEDREINLTRYDEVVNEYVKVTWTVNDEKDLIKPKWTNTPKFNKNSWIGFGCGPAVYAHFSASAADQSEILVLTEFHEVNSKETQQYLIKIVKGSIDVGHGMCSGGFTYMDKKDLKYAVRFKLYDVCGNQSENWTSWLTFKNPSDEKGW